MNIRVNPLEHVPASLKDWLAKPRPMLIDGKWVMAKSGKTFDVQDPATEQKLATVAEGDAADIDAAVKAARRALTGPWGKMSPSARGRIIHKIGDLILEHLDELAQLESLDNGKPFSRGPRRGRAAFRRPVPLHGRLGHQAGRQVHPHL